ncbi:MAG: leucine-rich repeat domain-containing protein, partial [Methanomassiliicoccaceae archaeon]|nr:leucine-rich repeat domain-containing protein [Methanomassiliicoccaceae archaeon]
MEKWEGENTSMENKINTTENRINNKRNAPRKTALPVIAVAAAAFILAAAAFALFTPSGSDGQNDDEVLGFSFRIDDTYYDILTGNTVSVNSCPSTNADIVVPETVVNNGTTYTVTAIGDRAFDGSIYTALSGLKSLTIPSTVKTIGWSAISSLESLEVLTIMEGVETIGAQGISFCSNLTSVVLPTTVKSIGDSLFQSNLNLKYVSMPSSVTQIGKQIFTGCLSLELVTAPYSMMSNIANQYYDSGVNPIKIFYSGTPLVTAEKSGQTVSLDIHSENFLQAAVGTTYGGKEIMTMNGPQGSFTAVNGTDYFIKVLLDPSASPGDGRYQEPDVAPMVYDPDRMLSNVALPVGWTWNSGTTVPEVINSGYSATYTPINDDYATITKTITVTVTPKPVNKPNTSYRSFVYSGSPQTFIPVGFDSKTMTITGNEKTIVGTYTANVNLVNTSNYMWSGDGSNNQLSVSWGITKASGKNAPDYTTPANISTTYSPIGKLSDVSLPEKWQWADGSTIPTVDNAGYAAIFTPQDTHNYDQVSETVFVKVYPMFIPIPEGGSLLYNGTEQTLITGYDAGVISAYGNKGTDAGTYTVRLELKDKINYRWDNDGGFAGTVSDQDVLVQITKITVGGSDAELIIEKITDRTYTGSQITPEPNVWYNDVQLVKDRDFTYTYGQNIDAGTGAGSVTVNFIGNYSGSATVTFNITKITITDGDSKLKIDDIDDQKYTGNPIEPTPGVQYGANELIEGTDFTYSYGENIDAGTGAGSVTITFKGNYSGSVTVKFNITKIAITDGDPLLVIEEIEDQKYTGNPIEPNPGVSYDGTPLIEGTDFTYSYGENIDAGTGAGSVTITFKGNYSGSVTVTFNITEIAITDGDSELKIDVIADQKYTGSQITPEPNVWYNDVQLVKDRDFTYSYGENINAGTDAGSVTITFIGNYSGSVTVKFNIIPFKMSGGDLLLVIEKIDDQKYTGSPIEPEPGVSYDGVPIAKDGNFTYAYTNNINVGQGSVIITFEGNYDGTIIVAFKIIKKDITSGDDDLRIEEIEDQKYTGNQIRPKPGVSYNGKGLTEGTDFMYSYGDNVNVGTGTVTVNFIGNYSGSVTVSFKIIMFNITEGDEDLDIGTIADREYTGSPIEPEPDVWYNGVKLVKDKDFTYAYGDNINVGEGTVTIDFIGNYSGSVTVKFNIIPLIMDGDDPLLAIEEIDDYKYIGEQIKPEPDVWYNKVLLLKDKDFTYAYGENLVVGPGTVIIVFEGNYSGTATAVFNIIPGLITGDDPLLYIKEIEDQKYTGQQIKPEPEVRYDEPLLVKDKDFTYSYGENINAGKGMGTVTVNFIGNYAGTVTVTFNIAKVTIVDGDDKLAIDEIGKQAYTGNQIRPEPGVSYNGEDLIEGSDFMYSYGDNINVGPGYVIIDFMGNYEGSVEVPFEIVALSITEGDGDLEIGTIADQEYKGVQIKPEPDVWYNGVKLVKYKDFTYDYGENMVVGPGTVIIVFEGNYSGTATAVFNIIPLIMDGDDPLLAIDTIGNRNYTGNPIEPEPNVRYNSILLVKGTDFTYSYKNNINVGQAYVTIVFEGNYSGTVTVTFDILEGIIDEDDPLLAIEKIGGKEYTGKQIRPKPGVRYGANELIEGTDFTYSYGDNINAGTGAGSVTVNFIGNYSGSATVTFNITKITITDGDS